MLHIGADRMVRKKDVLFLLDLQKPLSDDTRAFLESVKREGRYETCDGAKSAAVVFFDGKTHAYESPVSSATLFKRSVLTDSQDGRER